VYYESHQDVEVAIGREKQIKRWRREKKIALIEKMNPRWQTSPRIGAAKCAFEDSLSVELPESSSLRTHPRDLSTRTQSLRSLVVGRDDSHWQ
jgi:hypothetical protein